MAEHIDCGSSLLVSLADDVLGIIGRSLSTRDICNLSTCCKSLNVATSFDKIWLAKCEELGVLSSRDLVEWRKAVLSYKALCRFLTSVKPLLGIWVNHNWDLGNVVYVMPGFASVVGCRVIPQDVGPSSIEGGPILWAPVFEVISDDNGALAFVLHGRDKGQDYIYPGTMKSIGKTCNVLLLEVEYKEKNNANCVYTKSPHCHLKEETGKKKSKLHSRISKWLRFADKSSVAMPVKKLSFVDRWKLLEIVTGSIRIKVPYSTCDSLFPCLRGDEYRFWKNVAHSSEHREMLIKMHELGAGYTDWTANHEDSSELRDILKSGDIVGLTLQASTMLLTDSFSGWPYTNGSLFALYKLLIREPTVGQEYAGSWRVTFGWPPHKLTENKVLFFVILSYKEMSPGQRFLKATKIFDGTEYAPCGNGSAVFTVNVDKPSTESFPWSSGADSLSVGVTQAFTGFGDGDGYGFGRAGSTPGSLFVLEDGVLAFVWTETGSVVTLQRVNLDEVLRNGQRVPPLPPVNNFSYLYSVYSSYPNVFADMKA
ncbi:hypothetical protein RND81_09G231800 [Saponaria officinalis]|uniref:F-box domain-containing protein n=1 Tax=Saponaria officinalis TaxID=3572 RepID=A0AAW1IPV4_SAPOF